jgi:hypothetical protein
VKKIDVFRELCGETRELQNFHGHFSKGRPLLENDEKKEILGWPLCK